MVDPNTKSFESSYYCPTCEDQRGGYVPLCAKVRRENAGNTLTCSQIWHTVWGCGTLIPAHLRKTFATDRESEKTLRKRTQQKNEMEGDSD
ncbi:Hypothetical protein PHPALM_36856 [Phytophthora palmivora]|uniref:Uncharacterized protein n=1 Tax=Phytophthora palmivora TaxID=4796 RepID=A0A2P4WYV5_9STRA|nr:Hypothetical protein PHPALM_36856 [Phytophthora palmivora]